MVVVVSEVHAYLGFLEVLLFILYREAHLSRLVSVTIISLNIYSMPRHYRVLGSKLGREVFKSYVFEFGI